MPECQIPRKSKGTNPPFRIAMILPGLGRVRRGAETAYIEAAKALVHNHGVEVDLFGGALLDIPGVKTHSIAHMSREKVPFVPGIPLARNSYQIEEASFILNLALSGLYRPSLYDAVLHSGFPYTNWFLRCGRRPKTQALVYWAQNGDWACHTKSSEYRFFKCDGLVCINPEQRDRNQERWPTCLVPNGVDTNFFHPKADGSPEKPSAWPRAKKVIMMASALVPTKRVDLAIKAVAGLEDVALVVAGDGPLRQELALLGETLMPGRLFLAGSQSAETLKDWYASADLFLHTAREEPFGIVYLEAMASGLSIVHPEEATPKWIMGDAGKPVEVTDSALLEKTLKESLFGNTFAFDRIRARNRAEEGWSWTTQTGKLLTFLRDLSDKKATRTRAAKFQGVLS